MDAGTLIAELKRRRVFRVLVGYGIVSFAVLQIIEPIMHALHLPDVTLTYVVLALAVGFPVAVVLAWAFDVNEGRIERTPPAASSTLTGNRLRLLLIGIGLVAATPGVVWYFAWPGHVRTTAEAVTVTPSIAVLPFADMSPGKDQEYFSDGIAEEILNALAHVEKLRVIGRTSSFSFKGKNEDLRSIGQKLGVSAVLEGSVRKAGDQVRITTQLINANDGSHVWSETYDRKLTDLFAVQDEIAKAVVTALKLKLLADQVPTTKDRRTINPEVYNQYLLGRQFLIRGNPEVISRSVQAFEKALALDPAYAPAWAGLSTATLFRAGMLGGTAAQVVAAQERALTAAEKAVALAPDLADGYTARGRARVWARWDWAGGRADMQYALTLNPSDVTARFHLAADVLHPLGQLPEAIAVARKAIELDPLDQGSWTILGLVLSSAGEFKEAKDALGHALEISPEDDWAGLNLGIVDLLEGQPEKALARHARLSNEWCRLTGVALTQFDLGHPRESEDALDKLLAMHSEDSAYQVAQVYSRRGEKDRSLDWLERAYVQRDVGLRSVKSDPLLRNLHGDPRYTALLKKMNLPPD